MEWTTFRFSMMSGLIPMDCSSMAAASPQGPAPIMMTCSVMHRLALSPSVLQLIPMADNIFEHTRF